MHVVFSNEDNFLQLWKSLFEKVDHQCPLYLPLGIEYQKEYCSDITFTDLSFVIAEKNNPILGIIMSLDQKKDGYTELSGFGRPIIYLEANDISFQLLKGARRKLKTIFEKNLNAHQVMKVVYKDFLPKDNLSFFGNYLLASGASTYPFFTQIIELSLTESRLHSSLRKSYQSLINWGKKNMEINILDNETIKYDDIESFRRLHILSAGRETRSKKTWETQYEMVNNEEAFVITGEYENKLVTAAMFLRSPKLCYYGISASRKELFDKPISHVIIWNAILHAKKLGCHYFEMGEQFFTNQGESLPTKKELGISTFKKGFGGKTKVFLIISNLYD